MGIRNFGYGSNVEVPSMTELKVKGGNFGIKGNFKMRVSDVPNLISRREMRVKLLILLPSLPSHSFYGPCSSFLLAFPIVANSIYQDNSQSL